MSRYTDMIISAARGEYEDAHGTGATAVIKYDSGSMALNMAELFPVSRQDLNRIISALDRVPSWDDARSAAETMHRYCADMIVIYKLFSAQRFNNDSGKTFCAAQVKRYAVTVDALADRYGLDKSDVEKQPRAKKENVLSLESNENGEKTVKCYDGKKFEKYGRTWHVYAEKRGRHTHYNVIDPATGRKLFSADTMQKAISELDEAKNARFTEITASADYKEWREEWRDLVMASNYVYLIDDAETPANEAPEETPSPVPAAPAEETPENVNAPAENVETAPEKPAKNKIPRAAVRLDVVLNGAHMIVDKMPASWTGTDDNGKKWHIFPAALRNGELCTINAIYTAEDLRKHSDLMPYNPDNVDAGAVLDRFRYRYQWLYNMAGREFELPAFNDAVRIFDAGLNEADLDVLRRFNELRNDFISSDREAAAFIMALVDVLNTPRAQDAPTTTDHENVNTDAATTARTEDIQTPENRATGAPGRTEDAQRALVHDGPEGATMQKSAITVPQTFNEDGAPPAARGPRTAPGGTVYRSRTLHAILPAARRRHGPGPNIYAAHGIAGARRPRTGPTWQYNAPGRPRSSPGDYICGISPHADKPRHTTPGCRLLITAGPRTVTGRGTASPWETLKGPPNGTRKQTDHGTRIATAAHDINRRTKNDAHNGAGGTGTMTDNRTHAGRMETGPAPYTIQRGAGSARHNITGVADHGKRHGRRTAQEARTTRIDAATGRSTSTAPGGLVKRRQALRRLVIYSSCARPGILRRVHQVKPAAPYMTVNAAEDRQKTPGGPAAVYDHTGAGVAPYGARSGLYLSRERAPIIGAQYVRDASQRPAARPAHINGTGCTLAPWNVSKGPPRHAVRGTG